MPDIRRDPVVGRWVIIATDRILRPSDLFPSQPPPGPASGLCPFCPGEERLTPRELLAYRPGGGDANGPGWQVRVIPNKYPALQVEGNLDREGLGLFDRMNGIGAHEVLVETPDHKEGLADLAPGRIESVLRACRDRINDLKRDVRFRYIAFFKNHGVAAGATLEHSHSQLIALPVVPPALQAELQGCRDHFRGKERCIYCDVVKQEQRDAIRMIVDNPGFACLAPYAARFPFEMWVLPKQHAKAFEDSDDGLLEWCARILSESLRRLNRVLSRPAYNLVLHNVPLHDRRAPFFHWHIEIVPRLTQLGGFEWGTGCHVNPIAPEESAKYLREAEI
jgi:UDPglucose--hexose-1-phosphate uridylyltransferase